MMNFDISNPFLQILFILLMVIVGCVQIFIGQKFFRKKASSLDQLAPDNKLNQKIGLSYIVGGIGCVLIATLGIFPIWVFSVGAFLFGFSLYYIRRIEKETLKMKGGDK